MKILLISLVKDFIKADEDNKPKGTFFFRIPSLALANIAALTPKEDEIIVIDEQISPVNYNLDVDLVAISVNTSISPRAYQIAEKFRKKGIKVVFGGMTPSLLPNEAIKHADAIVVGDADGIWEQLIKDFKKNKLKKIYVNSQKRDLSLLPLPKREIFKNMGYVTTNLVETSRGCFYSCKFCSVSPFYHRNHRTRPIKDVIKDIKSVQSFPKKIIIFVDDNLIADREYAKKLFKALIPLHIYWGSQATVNIGNDKELVELAAKSGCYAFFLGFETISTENLHSIGKWHNNVEKYKQTIELLHKNGILVEGGFMFGFDKDTHSVFKNTFKFINDSKLDGFLSIYLTPLPGTVLYDEFKRQKRLLSTDHAKFDFRHIVFKPKKMTTKDIYTGVSWITKEFYSKKLITKRVLFTLKDLLLHPSVRRLIGLMGLIGFSIGSRRRIIDYSFDGTFPKSFKNI